jgi:hypothetical protein
MINVTKELNYAHKKNPQKRNLWEIMEKILDMVNQSVQDALKKFQDNNNKEHEMT